MIPIFANEICCYDIGLAFVTNFFSSCKKLFSKRKINKPTSNPSMLFFTISQMNSQKLSYIML